MSQSKKRRDRRRNELAFARIEAEHHGRRLNQPPDNVIYVDFQKKRRTGQ